MLTNNRSMKRAIAALCVATLACSAVGCGEEKKEAIPTFSNATYIAQMATLKCYFLFHARFRCADSPGT